MAVAQKLAGYSLGQADLLRAMGKKKKRRSRRRVRPLLRGHAGQRLLDQAIRRCGTCWSRSRTTRSTRRTPRPTA